MIIAETVLAAGMLCTIRNRRSSDTYDVSWGAACQHGFQVGSGVSLERKLMFEIEDLPGVRDVTVRRQQDDFEVTVVMESLQFPLFRQIVQKELELTDKYPDYTFDFNVLPIAVVENAPPVHAA